MPKISISEKEVLSFLNSWANGVIAIGKEFINENDHKNCARDFIQKHYNFNSGNVLFKPTFTSEKIFRNNFEDALSYFVKGHIDEDSGFAIKPWKKIKILDVKILIEEVYSFTMGLLEFTPLNNESSIKVAFTFILEKDADDKLKIKVHHSSPVN